MRIEPLTNERIDDLATLFGADRSASGCWCMWFIVRVKDYHANGPAGNERRFRTLAADDPHPLGLVAYRDGAPVGWSALGPRARFARAARTPTMASTIRAEDDEVWLAPCVFVAAQARGRGVARAMVAATVDHARASGAKALEAFPTAGSKMTGADRQVGTEHLFASAGLRVIDRPSSNRVLMRIDFVSG